MWIKSGKARLRLIWERMAVEKGKLQANHLDAKYQISHYTVHQETILNTWDNVVKLKDEIRAEEKYHW